MAETPLITIISINFNEPELTYLFLDSVSKLTYKPIEVLIIENNSFRKVNQHDVSAHCPGARVCFAAENGGFGSGNNLGMREARGEYFFLVNNDTELGTDLLEELMVPFQKDPSAGIVCPKIRYFDFPDTFQYAGFTPISKLTGRNKAIAFQEKDLGQYDQPRKTFGAHGAAMLVKRKVTEVTGVFYEPYFLYYEELDWSYRILQAGYSIYYQPQGLVYHKESMSVGKNSPMKTYYLFRNRLLFMKRNLTAYRYFLFLIYYISIAIPKNVFRYLAMQDIRQLRAFVKGNIDGLTIKASGQSGKN